MTTDALRHDLTIAADGLGLVLTPNQAEHLLEAVLYSPALTETLGQLDDTEALSQDTVISKLAWETGAVRENVEGILLYRLLNNAHQGGLSLITEPALTYTYEPLGTTTRPEDEAAWTHVRATCTALGRPYLKGTK